MEWGRGMVVGKCGEYLLYVVKQILLCVARQICVGGVGKRDGCV